MSKDNPQNPYTRDETATRADLPLPVQRATVIDAQDNALHRATVQIYGTSTTENAAVLAPMYGSIWVPDEGTDVLVLYGADDTPYILGAWYAEDRVEGGYVDVPDYSAGDLRLGNNTGSHVTLSSEDNSIQIITEGNAPVDIDVQSAAVELSGTQTIPANDEWVKVEFDTIIDDNDNLWDDPNYEMEARFGGLYQIHADVLWPNAGSNKSYQLGVFLNGELIKQKFGQSATNKPLSMDVFTNELLDNGDRLDIRVQNNGNESRDIDGGPVTTEFSINRTGRRRAEDAV